MGKAKPFINRKQAESYSLVYRNAEAGAETSDRQWVESSKGVGLGRPDAEAVQQQGGPARQAPWWFQDEVDDISEERRKELIELGFPDDGYDYLKHLRVLGKGQASLEGHTEGGAQADVGPATFVPAVKTEKPADDRKTFDARRLTLHQAAQNADEAAQSAGGVSAFSKELAKLHKPTQAEVDELERLLLQYEYIEDDVQGQGDLLDDFVLSATQAQEAANSAAAAASSQRQDAADQSHSDAEESEGEDDSSEVSSSEALSEELSSRLGSHSQAGARRVGSIASTYWRPERQDRKENLSVIDERFEAMALEYDSDDIGELDERSDEGIQGAVSVDQYDKLLNKFLDDHPTSNHVHEAGFAYHTAASDGSNHLHDKEAVAKTKALLRIAEEEDQEEPARPSTSGIRTAQHEEAQQHWDCESVLSLRSNLDNHPGSISEPSARKYRPQSGKIKLAAKTGLPVGPGRAQNAPLDFETYSHATSASAANPRLKGESTEERKQRKSAVKHAKREARSAKKELKNMFKEEALKQHKRQATPASSILPL